VGISDVPIFTNVLAAIGKDDLNEIKTGYVRMCLQANIHNALTSYYYLLAKRMTI